MSGNFRIGRRDIDATDRPYIYVSGMLYVERNAFLDRQNHRIGPGLSVVHGYRGGGSLDVGRRRVRRRHSYWRWPFRIPSTARPRRFLPERRQETTARLRLKEPPSHQLPENHKSIQWVSTYVTFFLKTCRLCIFSLVSFSPFAK